MSSDLDKEAMSFSDLSDDIRDEIFLKLSVQSIFACRSVCKLWYDLLSNPKFVEDHLRLANQRKDNRRLMLCNIDDNPAVSSIDFVSLFPLSCEYQCDGDVLMDYPISPFQYGDVEAIRIFGSCNGLICLGVLTVNSKFKKIYIWNPSTREYKAIPECVNWLNFRYGFGFDENIDDYKVICVPYDNFYECLGGIQVYTLGSNSWHVVQTIPFWLHYHLKFSSLLWMNGALHWLGYTNTSSSEFIFSFELSNERLMQLPFPEKNKDWSRYGILYRSVGVLGDCICLNIGYDTKHIDIWVMQDYGVVKSWTKRFTILQRLQGHLCCKPIWSFQNGEILLDTLSDLLIYDPKSGACRMAMPAPDTCNGTDLEFYVESLVSVKSASYVEKRIQN